jgi:hypothetical protein
MGLLYANTVIPRLRGIGDTTRAYWRWGDLFDRDWDIPKVQVSISFVDNPRAGRISMGINLRDTEHGRTVSDRMKDADEYWDELPKIVCPSLEGFPPTSGIAPFCAKEKTHLSTVDRTSYFPAQK